MFSVQDTLNWVPSVMSDNAADRKDVRRREKAARQAEVARREVIAQLMSTTPGRQWLWDKLSECQCFHTTFVTGDALASAFQEGRRSMGLSLLADIMAHCPDQYIQAMRESNERSTLDERRSSPQSDGGDSGSVTDPDTGDEARSLDDYDIYRPEEYRTGVEH